MSDYMHDDDLFSVVADDSAAEPLETASGSLMAETPLWETGNDGPHTPDAEPSWSPADVEPSWSPADVEPSWSPADVEPSWSPGPWDTEADPYSDGPHTPDGPVQYDPDYDPDTAPYDAEEHNPPPPGMDPVDYDPDTAPYDAEEHNPPPPGMQPFDPDYGYELYDNAVQPWGATFDDDGNMSYTPPPWDADDFAGVGDPIGDAQYWEEQSTPTNCAVVTQTMMIEKLMGIEIDQDTAMLQAEEAGIYDRENGTPISDMGKFLELYGIDAEPVPNADIDDLVTALESGDQVMVSLDASEYWTPMYDPDTGLPMEQDSEMGHAVWVTGVDVQPDGSVYILMNDPGAPFGQCEPVPLDAFLQAWDDFGQNMTVAHPVGA